MMPAANDFNDDTLAHAHDVLVELRGVVVLLDGCPLEYKLSAGLFVGLLRPMQQSLDQIVDDLRTEAAQRARIMVQGARLN